MPLRLAHLVRALLLPLVMLGLTSATSCAGAPAPPQTHAPAAGSNWVEPPPRATTTTAAEPTRPLVLAADVGGEHDALIGDDRVRAEYGPGDPWLGAAQPTVTMVVFFDYECPYCRKLMPTLYSLAELHPQDVRVVFKHFPLPFHKNAEFAATASVAALRQGRFWAMHDVLLGESNLGRAAVREHAIRMGLNAAAFDAALDDAGIVALIDEHVALGKGLGVSGTPTMFINGRKLSGALSLDTLRDEVKAEKRITRRLMSAGAPRNALYAHFMHAADSGDTAVVGTKAPPSRDIADAQRRDVNTSNLPSKGAPDPRVVIVECADFDCPFCGRARRTLEELLAAHPNDVALFFQHLPLAFHKGAEPAARAAVAAQAQGKFWPMHDLLFDNPKMRSPAQLEKLAKKTGLNVTRWKKAFGSRKIADQVQAQSEACTASDIKGTPGFLINGRLMSGARPLADFEAVVREELDRHR